ncbi:Gp88 [Thermobacillus xylanilyticus]|jgi:hypothetical protein|uniref:Gp88 n=1 Tax=Thermobacillus xylanilyticus TaxID=76633 RepID=A0ABM8V4X2_THEXY|nr:hypothetical protein [Thermobacillus xylanilyticus]CAG5087803.1 Gp88 [Thermobacillus xylanilyticus]
MKDGAICENAELRKLLLPNQTLRIAYHVVKNCFSVRDRRSRKVIGYTDRIVLYDVQFVVSQAGRARVLRERQKNVHAFVVGKYDETLQSLSIDPTYQQAYYNPYRTETFINRATLIPVQSAKIAICENRAVYYR